MVGHPRATIINLILSLVIDIVGILTYSVPFIGELFDVIWSFISGYLIYRMYGRRNFALFGIAEELLPFTDLIPTATLTWLYLFFFAGSDESLPEKTASKQ